MGLIANSPNSGHWQEGRTIQIFTHDLAGSFTSLFTVCKSQIAINLVFGESGSPATPIQTDEFRLMPLCSLSP